MEHDMNEVSVGIKTKAEVLETCLQQMKACFLDVSELYHIYYLSSLCGCNGRKLKSMILYL